MQLPVSVTPELQSNNSFWLFYSLKAEYLGRKKTCSMTCGAIIDKGCNIARSVIQSCHQACLRKMGKKRYPSINVKPLSTMITLFMKHFISCQRHPCLIILLFRHQPPLRTYGIFFTQCFVFSRLQMNVPFGTRAYCRNFTIQAGIAET